MYMQACMSVYINEQIHIHVYELEHQGALARAFALSLPSPACARRIANPRPLRHTHNTPLAPYPTPHRLHPVPSLTSPNPLLAPL